MRFLGEARRVARELVIVDSSQEHSPVDEDSSRGCSRTVPAGVFKRYFTGPRAWPTELGGGEMLFAGHWFVVVRSPVTRRRPSYRCLASLQRDNASAARAPRPASRSSRGRCSRAARGQRAYLLGQAPGVVEGEERRPWRGRAGRTRRRCSTSRRTSSTLRSTARR